jgi:hypothetical protein
VFPWPPSLWTRKDVADIVEFVSGAAALGCSAWAACAPLGEKRNPAIWAAIAGGVTLAAKFYSKRREAVEKQEREASAKALAKRTACAILTDMHEIYFSQEAGHEKYKHRATLFVCTERDGGAGKGKHLAIFARAGVYPASNRTWPLDDSHPDGCRGVAGKIWYHGITDIKVAVCDWPQDGNRVDKERYAASLDITVEEAEALNVKSRAFAGAPVIVGGRKWGVLLLDSLKDGFITDTPRKKGLLNRYTDLTGRVLTEAGA